MYQSRVDTVGKRDPSMWGIRMIRYSSTVRYTDTHYEKNQAGNNVFSFTMTCDIGKACILLSSIGSTAVFLRLNRLFQIVRLLVLTDRSVGRKRRILNEKKRATQTCSEPIDFQNFGVKMFFSTSRVQKKTVSSREKSKLAELRRFLFPANQSINQPTLPIHMYVNGWYQTNERSIDRLIDWLTILWIETFFTKNFAANEFNFAFDDFCRRKKLFPKKRSVLIHWINFEKKVSTF